VVFCVKDGSGKPKARNERGLAADSLTATQTHTKNQGLIAGTPKKFQCLHAAQHF